MSLACVSCASHRLGVAVCGVVDATVVVGAIARPRHTARASRV
jgi:hypothetical protein